jgi:predicted nucleic acid-binding protein
VYNTKCDRDAKQVLAGGKAATLNDFFNQAFIVKTQVDRNIAELAREILSTNYPKLKKPNDGIHVASAAFYNCDILYTYDGNDILHLDQKVLRKDGDFLRIITPDQETFQLV